MDDNWPIPSEIYSMFSSLRMGEADHAAWGFDCECTRCMVHRVATAPPAPRTYRTPGYVANPRDAACPAGEYPCGHPRSAANSIRTSPNARGGWSSSCRECNRLMAARYKARVRARRAEARRNARPITQA